MSTSIFIVTYAKDAEWLFWCLKSIQKFASGFEQVVVAFPFRDEKNLRSVVMDNGAHPLLYAEHAHPYGHIHHCLMKCTANEYVDSDHILYLDSDCIFNQKVSPDDYFVGGKPVLLIESYESLSRHPDGKAALCWIPGTEAALGFRPTHETMRRHPAIHSIKMLNGFRSHVESVHGVSLESFAFQQQPHRPVGFNDFNNLGSYALKFHREDYHFIDLSGHQELRPVDKVTQYWSHSSPSKPQEGWRMGRKTSVIPVSEINNLLKS